MGRDDSGGGRRRLDVLAGGAAVCVSRMGPPETNAARQAAAALPGLRPFAPPLQRHAPRPSRDPQVRAGRSVGAVARTSARQGDAPPFRGTDGECYSIVHAAAFDVVKPNAFAAGSSAAHCR